MKDAISLIKDLISIPGPPGEEKYVREYLYNELIQLDFAPITDAKGNLVIELPGNPEKPSVLISAHMDEIGLMITRVEHNGYIRLAAYGGAYPWKWGEGPVIVMGTNSTSLPAILSFGSIHTNNEQSPVQKARSKPLEWEDTHLFTGLTFRELSSKGIRPGLRVALAPERRTLVRFGEFIAAPFLDDRADLAVMLQTLHHLKENPFPNPGPIIFIATTSEEVGGEGVRFHLQRRPSDICIALEIGPKTPDADFPINSHPTIWVRDSYAAMEAEDGRILSDICDKLDMAPHWQYITRGGSDASCCAASGLIARPITLGLPVENSHGFEIMHRDAPDKLTILLIEYLKYIYQE